MSHSKRYLRIAGLVIICLLGQGCGVKLVYNNADRLARWWVSDYIDMNKVQREYFNASTAELMHWHRTTQLAIYRDELLGLANTVESGSIDSAQLEQIVAEVETWGFAITTKAVPIGVDVLLSLTPKQLRAFDRALLKSNRDYEREAERDPNDIAKEEAKNYSKLLRRFVGRLSADQKALILNHHLEMAPDAQVILDYRREWQRKLQGGLRSQPPDAELLADLMLNFDKHYTPEFARMVEVNEAIYEDLTLELLASLKDAQRAKLVSELREYAEIFDELIAEARSVPPPQPTSLPRYVE